MISFLFLDILYLHTSIVYISLFVIRTLEDSNNAPNRVYFPFYDIDTRKYFQYSNARVFGVPI